MSQMRLYGLTGNRLYLNAEERTAILAAACHQTSYDCTVCETLH